MNGDSPAPYAPNPLGNGLRLAQVQDPTSPDYHPNDNANMTSQVVTWLDTYDETMDGKSVGTLYVQDVGSQAPYAGVGIYEESLVPASLTVLPGDVLDLQGPYQESGNIGSATFNAGTFLPQLYKPVGTFRYEFTPPDPKVITVDDLAENVGKKTDGAFAMSRRWLGMLVTIQNVSVAAAVPGPRVTYPMEEADGTVAANAPAISNENYNLHASTDGAGNPDPAGYPSGTRFSSVTGIVTWFYTFHIAPRTAADLVVAK